MQDAVYRIEPLSSKHDRKSFSCGVEPLDRYLQQQASQDVRRHIAATFLLVATPSTEIAGYYTLSATSLAFNELPECIMKKLPRYPLLPAILLGRLAVNKNCQGKRLGELLLVDALKRSLKLSQEMGAMAVVVEAKNEPAIKFYQRYGFIQLLDNANKLFLPHSTLEQLAL